MAGRNRPGGSFAFFTFSWFPFPLIVMACPFSKPTFPHFLRHASRRSLNPQISSSLTVGQRYGGLTSPTPTGSLEAFLNELDDLPCDVAMGLPNTTTQFRSPYYRTQQTSLCRSTCRTSLFDSSLDVCLG